MKLLPELIDRFNSGEIVYSLAADSDVEDLTSFFSSQPKSAFEFFKPHDFDRISLRALINQESFIMTIARTDDQVVGYAFLRCFANGKSFRGKIVDVKYRGKGIAKTFGKLTMEIAQTLGIGLFGTISKKNISSLESSKSSNTIKVIKELPNDYILIRYFPKA
ncbi:MAG: GNAT family N-acetyltransferase [Muribaculaceae bacterium]|nr:GNAT family N-acetyltransferase [Muribaculaceae bacterium]